MSSWAKYGEKWIRILISLQWLVNRWVISASLELRKYSTSIYDSCSDLWQNIFKSILQKIILNPIINELWLQWSTLNFSVICLFSRCFLFFNKCKYINKVVKPTLLLHQCYCPSIATSWYPLTVAGGRFLWL